MERLYSGFDGLDVAFQGFVSVGFLSALERAKQEAQSIQRAVTIEFHGLSLDVQSTGASGYSYRFDTGPDGETWFVAKSQNPLGWSIRASCKSMGLALYGFEAARERLFSRLEIFGASVFDHSIGRVDFAIDFAAPDFVLNPERVVSHWRATQSQYREREEQIDGDLHIVSQGRRVNSVTVGKMPGRQVIIYDKRREVIDRRKSYWWKIWGVEKSTRVWRIEVRAGKRELKDRWNITTFDELARELPLVLAETMRAIRLHADEQADSNVARQIVHPMWALAAEAAADPFNGAEIGEPEPIIEVAREEMREKYEALIAGLAASYSVICDLEAEEAPDKIGAGIMAAIAARIKLKPQKFRESHARAVKRLRFLKSGEAWGQPHYYADPIGA